MAKSKTDREADKKYAMDEYDAAQTALEMPKAFLLGMQAVVHHCHTSLDAQLSTCIREAVRAIDEASSVIGHAHHRAQQK